MGKSVEKFMPVLTETYTGCVLAAKKGKKYEMIATEEQKDCLEKEVKIRNIKTKSKY
ncbi:MAG: hypothetical protein HQK62_06170 [Desulfamplus sp.]|nr:hypothetical protein [Desulfamplus sp.]